MRPESRSEAPQGGFTLIEALIALAIAVLIMVAASQTLMAMKRGSDQIRLKGEARATSRRAMEYVGYHLRNASDMNRAGNNALAIVTWYERAGAAVQASWNNVANGSLADPGTDVLSLAVPTSGLSIPCDNWPGWNHAANAEWRFDLGCPSSQDNIDLFMEMTGHDPVTGMSGPIVLVDGNGALGLYQITNYLYNQNKLNSCVPDPVTNEINIHVTANPGLSDDINPPGGQPNLVNPVTMKVGVRFRSFRVRDGWLEQKDGLFNPATDNPGSAFVPILPNIEDLQVAWVFNDGTVWNSGAQQLPVATYPGSVPSQGTANAYDAVNVVGARLTVTARSSDEVFWEPDARYRRPAAEDRVEATTSDRFFHHASTDLVMIRNRALQR